MSFLIQGGGMPPIIACLSQYMYMVNSTLALHMNIPSWANHILQITDRQHKRQSSTLDVILSFQD